MTRSLPWVRASTRLQYSLDWDAHIHAHTHTCTFNDTPNCWHAHHRNSVPAAACRHVPAVWMWRSVGGAKASKDKDKPKQWKATEEEEKRAGASATDADAAGQAPEKTEGEGDAANTTLQIQSESHATPKMLTQYFIAVPMKWRLVTLLGLLRRQMATKYVRPPRRGAAVRIPLMAPCTHTHPPPHTHAQTHTYTLAHTHTHTHTQSSPVSLLSTLHALATLGHTDSARSSFSLRRATLWTSTSSSWRGCGTS